MPSMLSGVVGGGPASMSAPMLNTREVPASFAIVAVSDTGTVSFAIVGPPATTQLPDASTAEYEVEASPPPALASSVSSAAVTISSAGFEFACATLITGAFVKGSQSSGPPPSGFSSLNHTGQRERLERRVLALREAKGDDLRSNVDGARRAARRPARPMSTSWLPRLGAAQACAVP
jgi:hypothetical protein